ncbi:MAG: hypothetical protein ACYCZF_17675 [Anaerolineae bacterium]
MKQTHYPLFGVIILVLLLMLAACVPGSGQPPTLAPTVYFTPGAGTPAVSSSTWARFNRWEIAFEFPRNWYEWDQPQREMAAKDIRASLISDTISIPRTLQDLTAITSADQQGGLYIGVYSFKAAVSPEAFMADRRTYFGQAEAAGFLSIDGITLTTTAGYPTAEVVVQRATGGRSRTLYILQGDRCIQLQFVLFDLKRAAEFEPVFEHMLSTFQLAVN